MSEQAEGKVAEGELILRQIRTEPNGLESEIVWRTVKLTPYSDAELKLSFELWAILANSPSHQPGPLQDAKVEYAILVADLISFNQKHGRRLSTSAEPTEGS